MNTFWLFRTNLLSKENYHEFKDLETFKLNCHDFYILQTLWFLENNIFDKVIIWRLSNENIPDIIFKINEKKIIQRWVNNFNEVFKHPKPTISFFRGGFQEYDEITKKNPNFFGLKLYLAAGKRLLPQYGGIYDKILIEDERDNIQSNCIPFYKTTNNNIFKPLNLEKKYDICLISNFTQLKYKGTDFIINKISRDLFFKNKVICHIGNKSEIGEDLCERNEVTNIEFLGSLDRSKINEVLNQSKFGIVSSNYSDGCPRIITEILTSGTPLLLRHQTKLLNYYKKFGVIEFEDNEFSLMSENSFRLYRSLQLNLISNLDLFSMEKICKKNIELWKY